MSYDILEVPPRAGASSRFAIATSPTGINVTPAANLSICYGHALQQRVAEAEPLAPLAKDVILRKLVRTATGAYELRDCRALRLVPDAKPVGSGRFAKLNVQGGALLDDLFLGGEAWRQARDTDIYEAARQLAAAESIQGNDLRRLNELVQLAILARAGITRFERWNLPL